MLTMDRRLGGIVVLAVGLLIALVVPRVLSPGIDGVAVRAPLSAPPEVGSCLVVEEQLTDENVWAQMPFTLPDFRSVDCGKPHDLEIAESWPTQTPFEFPEDSDDYPCQTTWTGYLGMEQALIPKPWYIAFLNVNVVFIGAPESQRLGDLGWMGCAVAPFPFSRTPGVVGNLPTLTDRPAAFGNCRLGQTYVSCLEPHDQEYLATAFGQQPDDPSIVLKDWPPLPSEEVLHQHCETMAASLLMRSDPTFDGQIEVQFTYEERPDQDLWIPGSGTSDVSYIRGTLTNAECLLVAAGGAVLTDSLVAIGEKPLPVEN